jgi:glycosyltransferase involved in cell wall biosynthesis
LLFLGKIGHRKGIFDLIEVLAENRSVYEGRLELIIGGNGDIKKLEKVIIERGLESIVKYEGWVSGEKKQWLFSECDVYILPSYNEGLPLSILEAMSYGLPIISTCVGGIPEIVFDGENGFLITPGNKKEIDLLLSNLLTNSELINIMGKNSNKIVSSYYPERVIPKLQKIYSSLLN